MPQVINFDVVTCDTVEVRKTVAGETRVWKLRDDVSAETMIRFFELARAEQTAEAAADQAADGEGGPTRGPARGVAEAFRAADRVYVAVLVEIFRHTYPETTEAELRAAFSYEERKQLVDLFFSLAGFASSGPSSGAPNSTPMPATSIPPSTDPTVAEPATPNRATRRAKKGKTSS